MKTSLELKSLRDLLIPGSAQMTMPLSLKYEWLGLVELQTTTMAAVPVYAHHSGRVLRRALPAATTAGLLLSSSLPLTTLAEPADTGLARQTLPKAAPELEVSASAGQAATASVGDYCEPWFMTANGPVLACDGIERKPAETAATAPVHSTSTRSVVHPAVAPIDTWAPQRETPAAQVPGDVPQPAAPDPFIPVSLPATASQRPAPFTPTAPAAVPPPIETSYAGDHCDPWIQTTEGLVYACDEEEAVATEAPASAQQPVPTTPAYTEIPLISETAQPPLPDTTQVNLPAPVQSPVSTEIKQFVISSHSPNTEATDTASPTTATPSQQDELTVLIHNVETDMQQAQAEYGTAAPYSEVTAARAAMPPKPVLYKQSQMATLKNGENTVSESVSGPQKTAVKPAVTAAKTAHTLAKPASQSSSAQADITAPVADSFAPFISDEMTHYARQSMTALPEDSNKGVNPPGLTTPPSAHTDSIAPFAGQATPPHVAKPKQSAVATASQPAWKKASKAQPVMSAATTPPKAGSSARPTIVDGSPRITVIPKTKPAKTKAAHASVQPSQQWLKSALNQIANEAATPSTPVKRNVHEPQETVSLLPPETSIFTANGELTDEYRRIAELALAEMGAVLKPRDAYAAGDAAVANPGSSSERSHRYGDTLATTTVESQGRYTYQPKRTHRYAADGWPANPAGFVTKQAVGLLRWLFWVR